MRQNHRASTLTVITILFLACTTTTAPSDIGKPSGLPPLPRRHALLVGINDYSASDLRGAAESPKSARSEWPSLSGAVNDVNAVREVLETSFGFERDDILMLTDQSATRVAILKAIETHLVGSLREGDLAVFYYSGHGSQVRNSKSKERDQLDESIVPADAPLGVPDIRDKELRQAFNRLLDKGVRVAIVLDSCFSGSGVKFPSATSPRRVKPDLRDVADGSDYGPRPEERGALVLSAAQDDEFAWETTVETEDGIADFGAFTWALLRSLRSAAERESAERVFLRARAWLRAAKRFQEPVLAGIPKVRRNPLFGDRVDRRDGKAVVVAERVAADGTVLLRGGWVNGLGNGSKLVKMPGADQAVPVRLEVTKVLGPSRSTARLIGTTARDRIRPGDLFELVTWVVPQGTPLQVWFPRYAETTAAGMIGEDVALRTGMASLAESLEIGPGSRNGAVVWTEDPEKAHYHLVGRGQGAGAEYAWIRPEASDMDAIRSGMPSRSAWVAAPRPRDVADQLEHHLLRLAKIHAWHELESPPGQAFPYRLRFFNERCGRLVEGKALHGGRKYSLVLELPEELAAAGIHVPDRYVYVFAIDNEGNSVLHFPRAPWGNTDNRFPRAPGAAPAEIALGRDSAFDIVEPFGVDTFFFLTTAEALWDPLVLEYEGVRGRGPAGRHALEELLSLTGGSRGTARSIETSVTWSIEKTVVQTLPAEQGRQVRQCQTPPLP